MRQAITEARLLAISDDVTHASCSSAGLQIIAGDNGAGR
jgi:hypothetical protein